MTGLIAPDCIFGKTAARWVLFRARSKDQRPSKCVRDADEKVLAELHGLDAEQINWRQLGSGQCFSQEYPLVADEAFISSTFDSFIPAGDPSGTGAGLKCRRQLGPRGGRVLLVKRRDQ